MSHDAQFITERINDPVHGALRLDRLERAVVGSGPVQRLKGIRQLALVDLVYPGATHTRFEHSLGTMHVAGLIAEHLGLDEIDIRKVRLAGLLHDVGHSAFSHAVESVLSRNEDCRPVLYEKSVFKHEQFTSFLIRSHKLGNEVDEIIGEELGPPDEILKSISDMIRGGVPPLGQIISGDIDADRIDFLLRDSHHTGVSLGLIDLDRIIDAMEVRGGRVILKGDGGYASDLSLTAAESMLTSRAHHYNALIHHPTVQSGRSMLLYVLESVLKGLDLASAKRCVFSFFTEFNDNDLTALLKREADGKAREMLERLSRGHVLPLAQRFDHRSLPPESRMALSTVARHGRMKQIFESCIMRDHGALADLSTGSGVPKSARTAYGFLYDESALAAGLIRSLTRQITLSLFSDTAVEISKADLDRLAGRLLRFIRIEAYMPTDGLLLIFHSLHKMLSNSFGERILVPRIRNITWIYRTVQSLSSKSSESGLRGLYDYNFHEDYGFPYSERLFEDIQILVAMGMVYQDLRQVEVAGRWIQRYEYMLTREGLAYSEVIAKAYPAEAEFISQALRMDRHSIPYDMVSMLSKAK